VVVGCSLPVLLVVMTGQVVPGGMGLLVR
jgi:hypothetical protein